MSTTPASVLAALKSIQGRATLSGQFIEVGDLSPIGQIYNSTGKWLGLIGGDYWHFGGTGAPAGVASFNASAKAYWNAGGLVTLSISIPNPTTGGGSSDVSRLDVAGLLVRGTATNTALNASLDAVAAGLADLQAAGVVVILRPYHELNGTWFYWGAGTMSAVQFQALWAYTHSYMTKTKGLTNLLWLWSVNAGFGSFPQTLLRFPPAGLVDLTGLDFYSSSPAGAQSDYQALVNLGLPVSLSEFGSGGPGAGDPNFSLPTLISALRSQMPRVVLWQQWWDGNAGGKPGWGMAAIRDVSAGLNDPWVINRGDLKYAAATAPPPVAVPAVVSSPAAAPVVTRATVQAKIDNAAEAARASTADIRADVGKLTP
jgi:mannan endo-1,4-beta-mannosidase